MPNKATSRLSSRTTYQTWTLHPATFYRESTEGLRSPQIRRSRPESEAPESKRVVNRGFDLKVWDIV